MKLCPSCREPLDYPSGDGCAAMTKHKEIVAADRIEELEKRCSVYARGDRLFVEEINDLEAKLAKAMESIKQSIKLWEKPDGGDRGYKLDNAYDGFELLCKALAELEGEDE